MSKLSTFLHSGTFDTGTIRANVLYAVPFSTPYSDTITEVSTFYSYGNLKVAVYSDSSGFPGTKLQELTLTNSIRGASFFGSNVALPRGVYWLVSIIDRDTNFMNVVAPPQSDVLLSVFDDVNNVGGLGWQTPMDYSSAFPTTFPTAQIIKPNEFAPYFLINVAGFTSGGSGGSGFSGFSGESGYSGENGSTSSGTDSFGATFDGLGGVISIGSKGFRVIPFNATITNWYVIGDVSGSISIDLKRSGTSIIGSGNKPTLSSQQRNNAAVAGWSSTTITPNDEIEFNIDSASIVTRVNLIIYITVTPI